MTEINLYGDGLIGPIKPTSKSVVADKFIIPPFSILNTRSGFWQKRKRRWIGLGIKSELGRDGKIKSKNSLAERMDRITDYDLPLNINRHGTKTGTSIFDPVLTELMYKWFCPVNGQIIDPFAGGSVRGIIASLLGYDYWGCDLSQFQIDANIKQGKDICENQPEWVCGDSLLEIKKAPKADFIFSCPPYGSLEKYSDDPRDISNMSYEDFITTYEKIISESCKRLKNNRFACFVVGDFRDKKGFYNNFVSETISCFINSGLKLYNEIILITAIGSLPIRITKQFEAARKIGKTHQNVLIFVKGDPKKATKEITK